MKLVMTLLCRDEADILADWIRFHISKGVDQIVVTDNGSRDNSVEILNSFASSGRVLILSEPNHVHDQAKWVSRMAHIAIEDLDADWVLHSDADEFWWCEEQSIREVLAACPSSVQALSVRRSNFLPPPEYSPNPAVPFWTRQVRREIRSTNYLGQPLPSKVCHRRAENVWVEDGNHAVRSSGRLLRTKTSKRLQIFHFPERSYEQFERKIRQGALALAANRRVSPDVGKTWAFVYQNYLSKGAVTLRDYYRSLSEGHDQNWILDTRLRDYMLVLQSRWTQAE